MAAAALPLAIGGLAIHGIASFASGQANASRARANASLAEQAAADTLQLGEQKAGKLQLRGEEVMGRQVAAYGHAGVDVSSGTPARVVSQTAMLTALDAEIERNNAARRAWGYREQASAFRRQARESQIASYLGIVGSGLSAAGAIAGAGGGGEADFGGAGGSIGGNLGGGIGG